LIDSENLRQQSSERAQLSDDPAILNLAPVTNWSQMEYGEHFAQFYQSDAFLLNSIAGYVAAGLTSGEVVVIIATPAHRHGLEALLLQNGIDVAGAKAQGLYIDLDAAAVLQRFMVHGSPDVNLVSQALSEIIEPARNRSKRLRVFGEMVALLWREGNQTAAIRLEGLWNELQTRHSFSLFCAYPLSGFRSDADTKPLKDVCATHTGIIPAESYTELKSADTRLRTILELQQKAEALQAEIGERKLAEAVLHQLKEELELQVTREQLARSEAENANRMKDEFLATISHELRTPLNAIIGWTHMLRTKHLDQASIELAFETIQRNAKAQAQLIEDILDVSRVITGKLRLNMEPVDVAAVITAAIDSVQLAAESKGIQLAITMDPSARHVRGDATRLQQVVWNLLSNAIKFTTSGGRVQINLQRLEGMVQILVTDSGQGIKPEFLPYIFDRFRQADGKTTRQYGGLGLGLAIVRHLVELHGGTVQANSSGPGLGSTFTVTLPFCAPDASSKPTPQNTSPAAQPGSTSELIPRLPFLNNVRVLLVDGDLDTLQLLTVMLRAQKAIVQTANSVAEALEVMEWFRPNVAVSDLAMPENDSYSLIREIRAREQTGVPHIPVIALTAYVRIEDRASALSSGFNMFVAKPVEPDELINAIANLVQSFNSRETQG
jgi:signal transduction histidine kinase/ActR/RegA family two-component response regulator